MKDLSISNPFGSVVGYSQESISSEFISYLDELLEQEPRDRFLFWLKEQAPESFSYIKHITVENEYKGQGKGTKLLHAFLAASSGPVILICDNLQTQEPGFELQSWYERQGFTSTGFSTLSGPIMIKKG